MNYVSGEILTEKGLIKGYLGFDKNKIIEIGKKKPPKKPVCKGLIVPSFVNAHTHIGDSFIKKRKIKLPKNIEELVKPPDGLKHRLLKEATEKEIIDGMKESIAIMINSGVTEFCDFREGGLSGVLQLKKALKNKKLSAIILSRPLELKYEFDKIETLLKNSDGIGVSSISDWDYLELEKISKHVKKRKKIFAIHASENVRENIDDILDLKPDFLVHMINATESDLIRVKDNNIPIVLCLRSNAFYGLNPNIKLMKKIGNTIIFGTDNSMLNSPNILDEIKFAKKVYREFSIVELLYAITFKARKALNLDCDILGANSKAEFVVINKKTLKPLYVSIK
ncbi:MAG: amidohydrolase family protein [Candidatus Thermoplasmatota archaeon]|jgi:cytosine/adenosine deaminase-related metal-dependent hydrolase|nr:amidohydrolase family protein [Candidatus Thermoplasmatota archaeon]